jgi:hypothetical protein
MATTNDVRVKLARAAALGVDVTEVRRALNIARDGGKLTVRVVNHADYVLGKLISAADPGVRTSTQLWATIPQQRDTGFRGGAKKASGNGGAYKGRSATLASIARHLPEGDPRRARYGV